MSLPTLKSSDGHSARARALLWEGPRPRGRHACYLLGPTLITHAQPTRPARTVAACARRVLTSHEGDTGSQAPVTAPPAVRTRNEAGSLRVPGMGLSGGSVRVFSEGKRSEQVAMSYDDQNRGLFSSFIFFTQITTIKVRKTLFNLGTELY